jgi:hypothetical protein
MAAQPDPNRGAPVPVEFETGKQWSKAVWPV